MRGLNVQSGHSKVGNQQNGRTSGVPGAACGTLGWMTSNRSSPNPSFGQLGFGHPVYGGWPGLGWREDIRAIPAEWTATRLWGELVRLLGNMLCRAVPGPKATLKRQQGPQRWITLCPEALGPDTTHQHP